MSSLNGFHHVTAITARVRENVRFYTDVLGLRLVKRTVNQDDVSAYHLFYADGAGSPGTDLTFFDWTVPPERRGTRTIARTGLRVGGAEALAWWQARLRERGVEAAEIAERDARLVLDFEDPEGQRLSLVDDGGRGGPPVPWERSGVPVDFAVRGLGPVALSVAELAPTASVLTEILGMEESRTYAHPENARQTVHVFEMAGGGAERELHVAVEPDLPPGRSGAGGVHHLALRTPDRAGYEEWLERLRSAGVPNSGPVDRFYFRSLYFREPGGILFEIATDGPGFAVDEDAATLGEKVVLPPFLEPRRAEILARLRPLE